MIQQLRLVHLLLVASMLVLPFTAAWPWPPSVENIEGLVFRRQDNSNTDTGSTASSSAQPTKTQADKSTTSSETASQTTDKASASGTKGTTAQMTGSRTSGQSSKTSEKATKTTGIDPRAPPGGVVLITPAPIALSEYYKIGDKITFAWNYTSLLATPTAINILVSCNVNKATYTISNNATFETTARVTWDTAEETGSPSLLTETYVLVIHDTDTAVTDVPKPGHLAPYNQFRFGMYITQPYVPLDQWVCATCSGALSEKERQTLKFVIGMCTLTILSFTWFVGGDVWF